MRPIKSEIISPVVVIVFRVVSTLAVVSLVIEYVADVDAVVTVVDGVVVADFRPFLMHLFPWEEFPLISSICNSEQLKCFLQKPLPCQSL